MTSSRAGTDIVPRQNDPVVLESGGRCFASAVADSRAVLICTAWSHHKGTSIFLNGVPLRKIGRIPRSFSTRTVHSSHSADGTFRVLRCGSHKNRFPNATSHLSLHPVAQVLL